MPGCDDADNAAPTLNLNYSSDAPYLSGPIVPTGGYQTQPHRDLKNWRCFTICEHRVETRSRNCGHTEEDERAREQWPEFLLNTRIVIAQYEVDNHDCQETNGDRKTRSKHDAVDHC